MKAHPYFLAAALVSSPLLLQAQETAEPDDTAEVIEAPADVEPAFQTQTPDPVQDAPAEPATEPDGGIVLEPAFSANTAAQSSVQSSWNAKQEPTAEHEPYHWNIKLGGYLRTRFSIIEDDPNSDIFGQNDGFVMASARFSIDGEMNDTLGFRLQLDGAVDQDLGATRPMSSLDTKLRDAFIWWKSTPYTRLSVGQFKPPYDVEESYSRQDQLFVLNSVASRGVNGVEGFGVSGLSRDREAGAMLDTDPIRFGGEDGFGVRYALAVTNGSPASMLNNDNQALATYGRLEILWGDIARLGGGGFLNSERIQPEEADFIDQEVFGWTADLTLNYAGVTLIGNMNQQSKKITDLEIQPETTTTGYQVSIAYQEPFFGFQPTFRYAYLDPTSGLSGQTVDPLFEMDARTFYTIGLNYNPAYPIRLMMNYTITDEENGVALQNNRFDALLQVMF